MQGYRVERKGGWDTHGLPVEIGVERELGLTGKSDIERYGVEEFNRLCRESVFRYVEDWQKMSERLGFWVDMDDPTAPWTTPTSRACGGPSKPSTRRTSSTRATRSAPTAPATRPPSPPPRSRWATSSTPSPSWTRASM
jgi:hypothetical protein